jgi:hypothetical protein
VHDGLGVVVRDHDYAGRVAPSIPLQRFDESDALALRDSQGPIPDGLTVFGES